MLPTASKSHSFTILHNYLLSNQSYRGKKEKNPSALTTRFFIYQNGRSMVFEAANCIKIYFYPTKATYFNPALYETRPVCNLGNE